MKVIFPPRPSSKIPPSYLPQMEAKGKYIVQRKFNGDRTLIHVSRGREVKLYSRRGRTHLLYKPPAELLKEILALNLHAGDEYWLDSELLHPLVPNTLVLFDVLQAGRYLYGVGQIERLSLLADICGHPTVPSDPAVAINISEHLWMAEHWEHGFSSLFRQYIHLDIIEGLILRLAASRLDNWGNKDYEVDWQIRCRKPGKNYLS